MQRLWKVKPPVSISNNEAWFGPGGSASGILLGRLAEVTQGAPPRLWLSTDKEQVVAIVGKRGSGKSFTLGVVIESLATTGTTQVSRNSGQQAVLVFDPLDVYWPTRFSVTPSAHPEVQEHYELASRYGVADVVPTVRALVPGRAAQRVGDPPWFETLQLSVPALTHSEWEVATGLDLMSDPMGQCLRDALAEVEGNQPYGIPAVIEATRRSTLEKAYHSETLRGLRQRLSSLESSGLFAQDGTSVSELLHPGAATVLLLGRVSDGLRIAIVAVLTRQLIESRRDATFAQKRLTLDHQISDEDRQALTEVLQAAPPRTVVCLDEAQIVAESGSRSSAREALVRLAKEGRNLGLSLVLATQQPSAVDSRILSQVGTFIAHQLVMSADISAVTGHLKAPPPASIEAGHSQFLLSDLLRSLRPGECVVSSAETTLSPPRSVLCAIRPRSTVHGGIEL